MNGTDIALSLLAVALVVLAALLASAEAALARVSRPRVEEMARESRRGVDALRTVLADPAGYLNLLLLMRKVFEIVAVTVVAVVVADTVGGRWPTVGITAAIMVPVSYVIVGVAPRTLGLQQAPAVALRAAGLAIVLTRLFGPLSRLLILIGNAITPGKGFREGPFASEAELRDLVDLAEERKVIEHNERDMIHGVFELGSTLVREVMVPRTDMVFVERTRTARQAQSLSLRSGFSRIPVVGESSDDVVGVVYLKDVVRKLSDARNSGDSLRIDDVMRPAIFVPDSKPVDELLREMQARQSHLAIVIDEYGGTAGLVTIEDILEEIVGEIADEYDKETPAVEEIDATTTRVTARMPVEDLERLFDAELEEEDVETVGGLLAHTLGRVPIPGATVTIGELTLVAEGLKGRRNRIGTVLVHHPARHGAAEPVETGSDKG